MAPGSPTVAIVAFEGFNEIDTFVALNMLNRIRAPKLKALLACPSDRARSMNGVVVERQAPLGFARKADAVFVGSGVSTRNVVADERLMAELRLNPKRQLIAAQCSGALVLAKLGLLDGMPACTDTQTRPSLEEAGVKVLDEPFVAHGNVATAGGCLASHVLAMWVIMRLAGWKAAEEVVYDVAPVGQKREYIRRAARLVEPSRRDALQAGVSITDPVVFLSARSR